MFIKYIIIIVLILMPCFGNTPDIRKTAQDFCGTRVSLIPAASSNMRYYFQNKSIRCEVIIYNTRYAYLRKSSQITVKKVRFRQNNIIFEFDSDQLFDGRIDFSFNRPLNEIPEDFFGEITHRIFSDSDSVPCAVNMQSGVIHQMYSNHTDSSMVKYDSLEKAVSEGYKQCPFCWHKEPDIHDFQFEEAVSREVQAEVRYYYALSADADINARCQTLCNEVLSAWPFLKRGYTYHNGVLESEEMQAVSCPGGYMYITSALLHAAESEQELEAVIAHETAHIELRHGYHGVRKMLSDIETDTVFSILLSVAAGDQTINEIYRAISEYSHAVVWSGYSRDYERAADICAAFYLFNRYGNCNGLIQILNKMKYLFSPYEITDRFSDHPSLSDRCNFLAGKKFTKIHKVTQGMDEKGNLIATCSFYGMIEDSEEVFMAGNIVFSDNLKRPVHVREGARCIAGSLEGKVITEFYGSCQSVIPVVMRFKSRPDNKACYIPVRGVTVWKDSDI